LLKNSKDSDTARKALTTLGTLIYRDKQTTLQVRDYITPTIEQFIMTFEKFKEDKGLEEIIEDIIRIL
jgi:hypothetical protein